MRMSLILLLGLSVVLAYSGPCYSQTNLTAKARKSPPHQKASDADLRSLKKEMKSFSQGQSSGHDVDECSEGDICTGYDGEDTEPTDAFRFILALQPTFGLPLTYGGSFTLGVAEVSRGMGFLYQGVSFGVTSGVQESTHALIEAGTIGIGSFRAGAGKRFDKDGQSDFIVEMGAGIIMGLAYVRIGRSRSEAGVQIFIPVGGG